jgi:hypothetical protein
VFWYPLRRAATVKKPSRTARTIDVLRTIECHERQWLSRIPGSGSLFDTEQVSARRPALAVVCYYGL